MDQQSIVDISELRDRLKELRKSGMLQEAYRWGKELRTRYPDEREIEFEFSWVIYDCLKRYKGNDPRFANNLDVFMQTLRLIPSYGFDVGANGMFFENVTKHLIGSIGWKLRDAKDLSSLQRLMDLLLEMDGSEKTNVYGGMLAGLVEPLISWGWDLRKSNDVDGLRDLLQSIIALGAHSPHYKKRTVLLMFCKGFEPSDDPQDTPIIQLKKADGMVLLAEWVGLDGLSTDMFHEEVHEGRTYSSVAKMLVKRLADVLGLRDRDGRFRYDERRIRSGLDSIARILEDDRTEDWIWTRYSYGKLLMQIDGAKAARSCFAKVLIGKWREPYIWGAFADTFEGEDPAAFSKCLFKGLCLSDSIGSSLSLHKKAMLLFKSTERFAEAKREAIIVSEYRASQGWLGSSIVEAQEREAWFAVEPTPDNSDLYVELSKGAEELVFPYAERADFYVEWIDEEKGLLGIVTIGAADVEDVSFAYLPIFEQRLRAALPRWMNGMHRTKVKDRALAGKLEVGRCYSGVLSKDARTILGAIDDCASAAFADRFLIEFEGMFDPVKPKDKQGSRSSIAFVRNTQRGSIFVPPPVLKDARAEAFDIVGGTARARFKDDRWSMEATAIWFLKKPAPEEVEKVISGCFESTDQPFGFVGECFVPEKLVRSEQLSMYCNVTVRARKSWDRKKGKWGWVAYEVTEKHKY